MLSLNSVSIKIDNNPIINNISMSFLPSAIIYLKGPNGSGKTSILRSIAGIQKISKGQITLGKNNTPIENVNKPYCTYLGHKTAVKPELTVYENIYFWAKIHESQETVDAAIFYFQLQDLVSTKAWALSAGQKQKVALARLFACDSMIWLLDEVESNLDSENKQLLNHLIISKADSGGIVISSSHNDPEIKSAITLNIIDWKI